MSDKRKQDVIKLLTNTIEIEKAKGNLCNHDTIDKLNAKLESILSGKNRGIKSR
tara:strand:- start:76 stop:237 length:162 start_codon:yes stop_codon:yes gene_type:complete